MVVKTFRTEEIIKGIRSGDAEVNTWLKANYLPQVALFIEKVNWRSDDSTVLFERTVVKIKQQIQFSRNIRNRTFKDIFHDRLRASWLDHISSFMADALVNRDKHNIVKHFTESIFPVVCSMVEKYKKSTSFTPQEVFQEAIWRVGENIHKGKYTETDTFKSYFLAIVSNILREEGRKSAKSVSFDEHFAETDKADDFDFDAFMSKEDDLTLLVELFEQADEKCKNILTLFYWKTLRINAIAEQTKLTVANVKQQLSRCRKKLKAAFLNEKNNRNE